MHYALHRFESSTTEEIIWVQTLATLRGHRLLPFPCFGISSIPPWINCQNSPSCIISKLQIQTSQTNLGMEKNTGSWAFPHHQKKSNGMKPATSTEKPAALRSFLKFANGIAGKFQWDQGSCIEATGKGTARNSKDQQQIGRNGETRALHAPVMLQKKTTVHQYQYL